jgi:riboflavin synthase
MAETLKHTSLKYMEEGTHVNLELAMQAGGRFGGHFVQGHVDATGTIASIEEEENMIYVHVQTPKEQLRYMTNKGSVTVDGISLTIFGVDDEKETFTLSIIPHTWQVTNLADKQAGDLVNIECDMLAKYTERLLTVDK